MSVFTSNYSVIWMLLTREPENSVTLEGNWNCRLNKGTAVVCQIESYIFCCYPGKLKYRVKSTYM